MIREVNNYNIYKYRMYITFNVIFAFKVKGKFIQSFLILNLEYS